MRLSKKEEYLMSLIWQMKKGYMKDLMEAYPAPKPATTTIATLLKRLTDKGAIGYELHGNSRQYFPLVDEKDYSSSYLTNMISTFFQGSTGRFASFFAQNANLSREELEELRGIIDDKIKNAEK